ncbi:unnamed protein product, partial [Protopolystoma xenopodis]
ATCIVPPISLPHLDTALSNAPIRRANSCVTSRPFLHNWRSLGLTNEFDEVRVSGSEEKDDTHLIGSSYPHQPREVLFSDADVLPTSVGKYLFGVGWAGSDQKYEKKEMGMEEKDEDYSDEVTEGYEVTPDSPQLEDGVAVEATALLVVTSEEGGALGENRFGRLSKSAVGDLWVGTNTGHLLRLPFMEINSNQGK